ncbi:unnamed protein product [Dovyalis caffra]|uniref:Uncharacterized protein n=1 Tax=Dovyalis caffra TaxID=77055 RepID=A0AAV1QW79_9ROSI|nr:unnamed protein product [Dovyalis caffra]
MKRRKEGAECRHASEVLARGFHEEHSSFVNIIMDPMHHTPAYRNDAHPAPTPTPTPNFDHDE